MHGQQNVKIFYFIIFLSLNHLSTCTNTFTEYIHIHTHTHTYLHKYTHTYIHTHTHTYIHTYIYTYIHTYIHTYTVTTFGNYFETVADMNRDYFIVFKPVKRSMALSEPSGPILLSKAVHYEPHNNETPFMYCRVT